MPSRPRADRLLGDLRNWNRSNVVALIAKLRTLRAERKIRFKDVIIASNLHDLRGKGKTETRIALAQQRLARLLKNVEHGEAWKNLREDEYLALLRYLNSKPELRSSGIAGGNIEMMFPDSMFFATAQWLKMEDHSLEDIKSNFTGVFTIFRHSLLKPGHVLIGRLRIIHDKRTGAVRTVETYHVEDSPTTPASDFELTGYLFHRNRDYRIISKETGSDELQYMFINATSRQGGTSNARLVTKMSGFLSDIQGHFFYSTRFCCIRKDPAKPTAVPVNEIPRDIMQSIGKGPTLEEGGFIAVF